MKTCCLFLQTCFLFLKSPVNIKNYFYISFFSCQHFLIRIVESNCRILYIMSVKKKRYDFCTFNKNSHASITTEKKDLMQCVICKNILSNDSLKPITKLKQRLQNVHSQHKNKSKSFFERHTGALKRISLDSSGTYC